MEQDSVYDNMVQELRRGVIVLAVLAQLQTEQYGYSILKELADKDLELDQGTLYPLLRRLEAQGLLASRWQLEESRQRRYYVISPEGRRVLDLLRTEWQKMSGMLGRLLACDDQQPESKE
jgi:PadR family transcriptional regulator, regulatory protein PadR